METAESLYPLGFENHSLIFDPKNELTPSEFLLEFVNNSNKNSSVSATMILPTLAPS